jgi:hypothetical protein
MLKFNHVIVVSYLDGIFNALEIDAHYDPHPLLRSERQSLKMDKTSGNKYCWSMKENPTTSASSLLSSYLEIRRLLV